MSADNQIPLVTDHDLHAFVDGEVDGRRYRRIVAHLAADPQAAERVNGFLRQHGELALLRDQLADIDPLGDRVTSDLTRELAGAMRHQRRVRFGVTGTGLAAAVLVGLVSLWGPDPSKVAERLSWSRHFADGGPQVLFGRDPFSGAAQFTVSESSDAPLKLDEQLAAYSIRRPDLAAHGLRFIGGDALQGGDTPSIRLVYEDKEARRVFLFVGAVGSEADVALTLVPEGHVSLNWRRGPLVFALIGPKESEQLLDVMAATGEFLAPSAPTVATVPTGTGNAEATVVTGSVAKSITAAPPAEGIERVLGPTTLVDPAGTPVPVAPSAVTKNVPKPL
jgi:anti-sigma factor RsiW